MKIKQIIQLIYTMCVFVCVCVSLNNGKVHNLKDKSLCVYTESF